MAEVLETKDEQKAAETVNDEKPATKEVDDDKKAVTAEEEDGSVDDEKSMENGTNEEDDESDKEENNKSDKEEGDDDDGESSEEELGLLEKPVEIISRKRDRKSTERFAEKKTEEKKKPEDELDYTKGTGVKLGSIPFIQFKLDRTYAEDLKPLHRLLYNRVGKLTMAKKHIRQFCGFPYEKDTKHYERMVARLERFNKAGVAFITTVLGLDPKGDTEEKRGKLLEFLMEPKDHEREIPKKTPKKNASKKKKKDKSEDSDNEVEEKPKKKKKDTPKKKETADKKKKKPTPVKIAAPKKKTKKETPKKKTPEKRKVMDDSDDDEPLLKKKKSEPTNAEIRKVITEILKDADLEQITMKTVCKQVYERYPDFDLTVKKDFIKTTVKEIIS